jgi:hypothetical protein
VHAPEPVQRVFGQDDDREAQSERRRHSGRGERLARGRTFPAQQRDRPERCCSSNENADAERERRAIRGSPQE